MHVVPAILKAGDDGMPSPYSVRVLTRDSTSRRAQELTRMGVECVQGAFSITVVLMSLDANCPAGRFDNQRDVAVAFKDCYAVFVNTDTYTVGARRDGCDRSEAIRSDQSSHWWPAPSNVRESARRTIVVSLIPNYWTDACGVPV